MRNSARCFAPAVLVLFIVAVLPLRSVADERDATCFQIYAPYSPEVDIGSDMAIVYGVGNTFADRAAAWRSKGYTIGIMTGIAWGEYDSYYGTGDAFKRDEVQTVKSGRLLMHGNSTTVGYNVPTDAYIDYVKRYVEPAVDAGARAMYLEEPEFWADAGWGLAFQREWQRFYNEPWQAPDSSPDAQYRASKLKYEMYFKALREVFAHAKARAKEKGATIECHVPTHSLLNYAQWRIVSPESHLIDIPNLDGYIAQVWTGTSRTPNVYQGARKERTFETAYLEYGQMLAMVRPSGKKVWFLADPVEDNPNHTWADYKSNYECTIVASLMWPDVSRFEVMPWPDRIFRGAYPKVNLDTKSSEKEGIPSGYATQLLTVINALNDMDQKDVAYDGGTHGIGVVVSDTMMFQRAAPEQSDPNLGSFYGLALPLLKVGVPVEVVQLENTIYPQCLAPYQVLLLTYEDQKPLKPEYHEALNQWVRNGGALLLVDDGSDLYNDVREWWNDGGKNGAKAYDDLLHRLGVTEKARNEAEPIGKGFLRVVAERPRDLQNAPGGATKVRGWVSDLLKRQGKELATKPYLSVRRGPYVIAAVLDETSPTDPAYTLTGSFVDLFDPELPVVASKTLHQNERTVLYDKNWALRNGFKAKVLAAGARVRDEHLDGTTFTCSMRGPAGTTANARILLPAEPKQVHTEPTLDVRTKWDAPSATLWLSLPNTADKVAVTIAW